MSSWFMKTEYSKKLIHSKIRIVKFNTGENKKNKRAYGVTFVITYHPPLNSHGIIRKSIYLVNIAQQVKEVFNYNPWCFLWCQ